MPRDRSTPTITVTARGRAAIGLAMLVLFGLFGVPRLLSTPPTPDEARVLIRDLKVRQVRNELSPRLTGNSREAGMEAAQALAAAIKEVQDRPLGDLRVRRSWLGPPFTYHWAYVVEARPPGG